MKNKYYKKLNNIIVNYMYFCPNCSYILDISKSTNITKNTDDRIPINKINDIFKLLDNNSLLNYKAEFTKDELIKNKKYQKLKDIDKIKIDELFEINSFSNAEFKCNNCNYTKQIINTTLLYQINMEDKIEKTYTLEENELLTNDPLLPHTHDYICKNPNCITHSKLDLKDAVFYKDRNSYKVNYICSKCYYNW